MAAAAINSSTFDLLELFAPFACPLLPTRHILHQLVAMWTQVVFHFQHTRSFKPIKCKLMLLHQTGKQTNGAHCIFTNTMTQRPRLNERSIKSTKRKKKTLSIQAKLKSVIFPQFLLSSHLSNHLVSSLRVKPFSL